MKSVVITSIDSKDHELCGIYSFIVLNFGKELEETIFDIVDSESEIKLEIFDFIRKDVNNYKTFYDFENSREYHVEIFGNLSFV